MKAETPPRAKRAWPRILGVGLALWVATVVVTFATSNVNLLPTIILLGSFLVPVTFVAWAYQRGQADGVTIGLVLLAFVVGGVLGVLGASILESYLLSPSIWMYFGVGLIEEGVKILALVLIAHRFPNKTMRTGLILGAAVGFGFAAFESSGYAMTAMFTERGLSIAQLVETEILRGLLAPFGHGLWTAILGGVLFSQSARGRIRITVKVILAYLGVSLLHAFWDSMTGIAVALTFLLTSTPAQTALFEHGYLPPATPGQVHLYTLIHWAGWILITAIALGWLLTLIRNSATPTQARTIGRSHAAGSPPSARPDAAEDRPPMRHPEEPSSPG